VSIARKRMVRTNTPAYFAGPLIAKKRFITLTLGSAAAATGKTIQLTTITIVK
jgi:hypothetical protein